MKADIVVPIKMTVDEYRYAKALSKRTPGCPRPKVGSIAHGLKWCLRQQAKKDNVPLNDD